jgi:16S rRNA (cytidine1402-2'-O)-methyltransferase
MEYGSLYLIPNYLGKDSLHEFNNNTKSIINEISYFVFENEKPGRAFLKAVSPTKNQSTLIVNTLNKFTVILV